MNYRLILDKIEALRTEKHWTINELAEKADLTSGTIYGWYSEARKKPSLEALATVAKALEVPLIWLLSENDDEQIKTLLVRELDFHCRDLDEEQIRALIAVAKAFKKSQSS